MENQLTSRRGSIVHCENGIESPQKNGKANLNYQHV